VDRFHKQYSWLICRAGCLGYSICKEVKCLGPTGAQGSGIRNTLGTEWVSQSTVWFNKNSAAKVSVHENK